VAGTSPNLVRTREHNPWLRVLARSALRFLRSRTQDPFTCSVDQTMHATVWQRPCLQALSRSVCPPAASPVRKRTGRVARAPSRRRPAPPTPFTIETPREGPARWASKTLHETKLVGRPLARATSSYGVLFLLESSHGFKFAAALAYPTFEPRALQPVHLGLFVPSPERL